MTFDPKSALLVALGAFSLFYIVLLIRTVSRRRAQASEGVTPSPALVGTGFITNFFDTLGIGSYATTTAIFRKWNLVRDENIPGTLNVGHTIPTIAQAFIFTKIVPVDAKTLILMIAAAVLGAWLGAGVVSHWPRRKVQIGMGLCLLGAAGLMTLSQLHVTPAGGTLLQLTGLKLVAAVLGTFLLGALMTLGMASMRHA